MNLVSLLLDGVVNNDVDAYQVAFELLSTIKVVDLTDEQTDVLVRLKRDGQ